MPTTTAPQSRRPGPGKVALLFIATIAAALGCVAFPLWVIRPFRAQAPGPLDFSLHLLAWSRWLLPALAVLALICAIDLWLRGPGKLRRAGIVFGLVLAAFALAASRVNIYERLFRPDPNPHFLPPAQAWVGDEDMVMAVRIGGVARAYPIRQMGYHHIINDLVAGRPIAVTY